MVSITLSVSEELKAQMDKHSIINWSAVARHAIEKQLSLLELLEEFTKDSELTESDALKLGKEINKKAHERFFNEIRSRR